MEIIKAIHVTATERKHLKAFLQSGMTQAKINRKQYDILKGVAEKGGYIYDVRITTPYRNDYGEQRLQTQTVTVFHKQN